MTTAPQQHPGLTARLQARWHALPALLRSALADGVLPLVVMVLGTLWISGPVARTPWGVVSRKLEALEPIDYGATLWFYDWVAQALGRGVHILEPDGVCAPTGTTLGTNFPNWGDAILAAPLVGPLPFPTGYNLWLALIPVLGGLAAYAALRCLTERRSLALLGAWLFGFNAYSCFQIVLGRPSLALVAVLPLFLAFWLKATSTDGVKAAGWSVLAGLTAGLALQFYVLYAALTWLLGALIWVGRVWHPPRSTWGPSVFVSGVLALATAAFCGAPYLYQATALQPRFPAPRAEFANPEGSLLVPPWSAGSGAVVEQTPLAPWDPELWRFTQAFTQDRYQRFGEMSEPAPGMLDDSLHTMARHSLPFEYAWSGVERRGDPAGLLPLAWLAPLVLILALLAGPRAWPWIVVVLLLWGLTLGPWLLGPDGARGTPLLVEGQRLRLPLWYLAQALPEAGSFLKPERLFPGFLMALSLALTVALDRIATRSQGWLERTWKPASAVLWPVLAAALMLVMGFSQAELSQDLDDTIPYEPWAFHQQLAADPQPGAIIELPLGLGQATAGFQLIHGRDRAEDHHDAIAPQRAGQAPPSDCYRLDLLRTLWDLGRGPQIPDTLATGELEEASQAGFAWVLVYPEAYTSHGLQDLGYDYDAVRGVLDRSLGGPIFEDDHIVAYGLTSASSAQQ